MKNLRTRCSPGPLSTWKKAVRSGTQTTTKSAILAGSPIMGLPAFCMTIGIAWIMRLALVELGRMTALTQPRKSLLICQMTRVVIIGI